MTWGSAWRWGQGEDQDRKLEQAAASPISWTGQFSTNRGGAVVFTLTASTAFTIAVLSAADMKGDATLLSPLKAEERDDLRCKA